MNKREKKREKKKEKLDKQGRTEKQERQEEQNENIYNTNQSEDIPNLPIINDPSKAISILKMTPKFIISIMLKKNPQYAKLIPGLLKQYPQYAKQIIHKLPSKYRSNENETSNISWITKNI